MNLTRPLTIIIDDAHPECCSHNCREWGCQGAFDYCGDECLTNDSEGRSLRTAECLRDAKEAP